MRLVFRLTQPGCFSCSTDYSPDFLNLVCKIASLALDPVWYLGIARFCITFPKLHYEVLKNIYSSTKYFTFLHLLQYITTFFEKQKSKIVVLFCFYSCDYNNQNYVQCGLFSSWHIHKHAGSTASWEQQQWVIPGSQSAYETIGICLYSEVSN